VVYQHKVPAEKEELVAAIGDATENDPEELLGVDERDFTLQTDQETGIRVLVRTSTGAGKQTYQDALFGDPTRGMRKVVRRALDGTELANER
jgi:hypothetical protein